MSKLQHIRYQMKQHKKIIQHLIEEAEPQQSKLSEEEEDFSADFSVVYDFQVYVDIGDGRSDTIFMNETSDPLKQAHLFCQKHHLEPFITHLLADSLSQQSRQEKISAKLASNKNSSYHPQRVIGADKLLSNSRRTSLYSKQKTRQVLWKEESPKGYPKMNDVSQQIVRKVGKDCIIEAMNKKFNEKMQKQIQENSETQIKQLQRYSFHPTINPISEKVDRTLHQSRNQGYSRFQQLYDNHKMIQSKRQELKRTSLNDISFKPQINNVSRTIMDKKKSLGEVKSIRETSHNRHSSVQNIFSMTRTKSKGKISRNLDTSIELGHHLYDQAKKREARIKKQKQKQSENKQNWKIIDNSNIMVNSLRQNRIKQIYRKLLIEGETELDYQDIEENQLTELEKIFMPIFKEMKELDTRLTEEEFLMAGVKLLKYLSPNERSLLMKKSLINNEINDKENKKMMNRKSRNIIDKKGYGGPNIYVRGVMFKREVKDQVEKSREEKVRRELQNCTFKPKIHQMPQNIAY